SRNFNPVGGLPGPAHSGGQFGGSSHSRDVKSDRVGGNTVTAGGDISGAVCMSPPTDLRGNMVDGPEAARLSPALRITKAPSHVVVSFGDPEPNKKSQDDFFLTDQSRLLVAALTEKGASPVTVVMPHPDTIP